MNSDTIRGGNAGKRIAPVYFVNEGELLLAAQIHSAWRHVINYPKWQNYSVVEHVSGPIGGEGELVRLKKEEAGMQFPPYYARTIKQEVPRRVIWKTYPVMVTEELNFFGIVDFKLCEEPRGTCFRYCSIYEFLVPYQREDELESFRIRQNEGAAAMFASVLPKLKQLVEEGA
jgi:hypothetical protein